MTYGLMLQGFNPKPADVIEGELLSDYRSIPGLEDVTLADPVFGQLIAIQTEREALVWQLALLVWQSGFRSSATGLSLDNTVNLIGKSRREEQRSTVTLTLYNRTSSNPVTVPVDSQARQGSTGVIWEILETVEIPALGEGDTETSVEVLARSYSAGAFEASPNSIQDIVTPISGWDAVTNPSAAITGREQENDTALRRRAAGETVSARGGTLEAVKQAVLNVPGVTYVSAEENDTEVTVNGLKPNSIHITVVGGTDQAIVDAIGQFKPAGIGTNGTEAGTWTDTTGNPHTIYFSRVDEVMPYLVVNLTKHSAWPDDGVDQVKAALLALTWAHGEDVLNFRLFSAIGSAGIPGLLTLEVLQGFDPDPTGTANLTIASTEVVNLTADRIEVNVS